LTSSQRILARSSSPAQNLPMLSISSSPV
jgi:hypothetical protein